jgi:YidC/Oxa1 family membrane protein insertase
MTDNRNLILALVLSAAVLFGWQYLVGVPKMNQAEQAHESTIAEQHKEGSARQTPSINAAAKEEILHLPRAQALKLSSVRVNIASNTVDGSINPTGARFDDLQLKNYRETVDPKSPEVQLLSPKSAEHSYYAEFGWIAPEGFTEPVPGDETLWKLTQGTTLSPGHDVLLSFDNGQGLLFTRQISVDADYMFTITDRVENNGASAVVLSPYAVVSRHKLPPSRPFWVLHEGFVGVADGTLKDAGYKDFDKGEPPQHFQSTGGWLGITDKYWMAAVIPPQNEPFQGSYSGRDDASGAKAYQADYLMQPRSIAPGKTTVVTHRLFAGAKVVSIVEGYRDKLGIARFDMAVDWGWFFFLTKPFFLALDLLYRYIGNFGVAIIVFTIILKLIFFPLQSTSFRAMARMKKLQPEMERIRGLHKDDKVKQQQEIMELYKREKANPFAGCVPILIQVPVFFSLYKVLIVTIEMRHAPFFGWIQDLSAPDPTSIFNLFGLIPFTPPSFLMIGVWPILMGITMWMQSKLNPPPADPTQAKIFGFMPWIFMFMMAGFPSGLVIYWTCNYILTIAQQAAIMKSQGVPVEIFDRVKAPLLALLKRGNEPGSAP